MIPEWNRPRRWLERYFDQLWERQPIAYMFGMSSDFQTCLIVMPGKGCHIVPVGQYGTLGRYECSGEHLSVYLDVYQSRFPVRWPDDELVMQRMVTRNADL